jgi:ElaB/YqjD/DUF883 family membrane-anchored ribosome-binding protein
MACSAHNRKLCRNCDNFGMTKSSESQGSIRMKRLQRRRSDLSTLFDHICVLEHSTISKIQQVAKTARDKVQRLVNETNTQMKKMYDEFSGELQTASEEYHYIETEVDWKEPSTNVQTELEEISSSVYSCGVDAAKESVLQPFSSSSVTGSRWLSENMDISNNPRLESVRDIQYIDENSLIEIESQILVDPIENINLILLQLSTPIQSQLSHFLNKFNDVNLSLLNKTNDWLTQLKQTKQFTLFIDTSNISFKDQDDLLNDISKLEHVHSVYIQGIPPNLDVDRKSFFSKYPIIKAMAENEQPLIVQWVTDTANEYRKTGDIYIEKGDKDKAQACFIKGVALYNRLSSFLNEQKHIK